MNSNETRLRNKHEKMETKRRFPRDTMHLRGICTIGAAESEQAAGPVHNEPRSKQTWLNAFQLEVITISILLQEILMFVFNQLHANRPVQVSRDGILDVLGSILGPETSDPEILILLSSDMPLLLFTSFISR